MAKVARVLHRNAHPEWVSSSPRRRLREQLSDDEDRAVWGNSEKMRAIAEEACALVKEYKGSYSGEHGDGLVRSEWIEPLYGARLTRAFAELKRSFDPKGLMNPGKIVAAPRMDDRRLFRFKPGYRTLPLATGLAILRYRLYDIDRIISRTVSYALLSALLAAVYGAVVILGSRLVAPLGAGSDLTVAAATLAAAALFAPARRRIQTVVDRRFNRARYDAEQVVARFRERLRDEVELEDVITATQSAAAGAVQPAQASLWLARREVAR